MRLLVAPLLLLTPSLVHADALAQLREALASLPATQSVSATVELEFTTSGRADDDDESEAKPETARLAVRAEAGGDDLRVLWPRAILDAAAAERGNRDPDAGQPLRAALARVDVQDIDAYLNAAPTLLNLIDQATVQADAPDTRDGRSLRRLTLALDPPLSAQARKYVKDIDATASIWVDEGGMPVAAERALKIGGRAMLVISFENETRESWEFARRGDRLVVTRHDSDSNSSGGGESGSERRRSSLRFE
jgi:hypothetical protein